MTRYSLPLWILLAASLVGCGENEPIRTETVPKPVPPVFEPKVTLLAAMLTHGEDQWFFKLLGPTAEVTDKRITAFEKFLKSVQFTGKENDPVKWDVPAGWEAGPKKEIRLATFFLGGKDKPPELSVFKFDRVSTVLENVNRWCRVDLGRPELRPRELKKIEQKIAVGEREAAFVKLTGPGVKPADPHAGMAMPKDVAKKMLAAPRTLPIEYKVPEGWKETGPRPGFADLRVITAFTVDAGPPRTEMTVTSGSAGLSVLENVNRWRGQVGAEPLTKLDSGPPMVKVGGVEGMYFDIQGKLRMLIVLAKRGERNWYFKLMGTPDVVAKNEAAFKAFIQSVQFTGGGR